MEGSELLSRLSRLSPRPVTLQSQGRLSKHVSALTNSGELSNTVELEAPTFVRPALKNALGSLRVHAGHEQTPLPAFFCRSICLTHAGCCLLTVERSQGVRRHSAGSGSGGAEHCRTMVQAACVLTNSMLLSYRLESQNRRSSRAFVLRDGNHTKSQQLPAVDIAALQDGERVLSPAIGLARNCEAGEIQSQARAHDVVSVP